MSQEQNQTLYNGVAGLDPMILLGLKWGKILGTEWEGLVYFADWGGGVLLLMTPSFY